MKVLIVDDEFSAREQSKRLIEQFFPEIMVCGEAESVDAAYESILINDPDLVLLDIDLPDGNAFDLLKKMPQINFSIIFITAFDQYAIQAIKFSALDYLLKPYTSGEFADAMRKAILKIKQAEIQTHFSTLIQNISNRNEPSKIVLRTAESIHVIAVNDIIRIEADGTYSKFYFTNRSPLMVSKNLKEYENMLEPQGFFRSHQSHLINSKHIVCFHKADGGAIGLSDQTKVPVATRFKEKVLKKLDQI
jgi:two-component system LytT family response regulator